MNFFKDIKPFIPLLSRVKNNGVIPRPFTPDDKKELLSIYAKHINKSKKPPCVSCNIFPYIRKLIDYYEKEPKHGIKVKL